MMFDIDAFLAAERERRWALLMHDVTAPNRRSDATLARMRHARALKRHQAAVADEMARLPAFRETVQAPASYDEILEAVTAERSLESYRQILDSQIDSARTMLERAATVREAVLADIDAETAAVWDAESERRIYGFGSMAAGWACYWFDKARERLAQ